MQKINILLPQIFGKYSYQPNKCKIYLIKWKLTILLNFSSCQTSSNFSNFSTIGAHGFPFLPFACPCQNGGFYPSNFPFSQVTLLKLVAYLVCFSCNMLIGLEQISRSNTAISAPPLQCGDFERLTHFYTPVISMN